MICSGRQKLALAMRCITSVDREDMLAKVSLYSSAVGGVSAFSSQCHSVSRSMRWKGDEARKRNCPFANAELHKASCFSDGKWQYLMAGSSREGVTSRLVGCCRLNGVRRRLHSSKLYYELMVGRCCCVVSFTWQLVSLR